MMTEMVFPKKPSIVPINPALAKACVLMIMSRASLFQLSQKYAARGIIQGPEKQVLENQCRGVFQVEFLEQAK